MTDFDSLISAGMAQATAVFGEPILIDGKPYTGTVSKFTLSRAMEAAGYIPEYALTVVIPLGQMAALPPVDSRAVFAEYKGRKMRVAKDSEIDSAGCTLYLEKIQ